MMSSLHKFTFYFKFTQDDNLITCLLDNVFHDETLHSFPLRMKRLQIWSSNQSPITASVTSHKAIPRVGVNKMDIKDPGIENNQA